MYFVLYSLTSDAYLVDWLCTGLEFHGGHCRRCPYTGRDAPYKWANITANFAVPFFPMAVVPFLEDPAVYHASASQCARCGSARSVHTVHKIKIKSKCTYVWRIKGKQNRCNGSTPMFEYMHETSTPRAAQPATTHARYTAHRPCPNWRLRLRLLLRGIPCYGRCSGQPMLSTHADAATSVAAKFGNGLTSQPATEGPTFDYNT